jgi:hypothetical protein
MILQGAFGEMQRADEKADPKALAGFQRLDRTTGKAERGGNARSTFISSTVQPLRSDSTITCIR